MRTCRHGLPPLTLFPKYINSLNLTSSRSNPVHSWLAAPLVHILKTTASALVIPDPQPPQSIFPKVGFMLFSTTSDTYTGSALRSALLYDFAESQHLPTFNTSHMQTKEDICNPLLNNSLELPLAILERCICPFNRTSPPQSLSLGSLWRAILLPISSKVRRAPGMAESMLFAQGEELCGRVQGPEKSRIVACAIGGRRCGGSGAGQAEIAEGKGVEIAEFEGRREQPVALRLSGSCSHSWCTASQESRTKGQEGRSR